MVRRPRNPTCNRDAVCPVILSQSAVTLTDKDEDSEEEEDGAHDIIKIGEGCIRDLCDLMDCFVVLYDTLHLFKCVLNRAYYGDISGGCRETGEDSDEWG